MKIYTYPKSRSLRVLWALEEMGVAYEPVRVALLGPGPGVKSPHPRGKVPFMTDGKISIGETLAICLYLCEQHPASTLYPAGITEKTSVNAWLSFALSDLEAPVWGLLKQKVFTPETQRSPDLLAHFTQEATQAVSQVRLNNGQNWLAGDNFTLADIFTSHNLLWAKLCGIALNENLENYLHRAMSRPAFLRAQEKNNL